MDVQTDGHTDVQRETIIPHYCRVAGYKNHYKNKPIHTENFPTKN